MSILEVAGKRYRTAKLPAIQQFHIGRRLAPILAAMGNEAGRLMQSRAPEDEVERYDGLAALLPVIAAVLSKMSDEETNYVIYGCLVAVEREEAPERWQKVTAANQLMFEDIDMGMMLRLVVEVIRENLGSFLMGLGAEVSSPSP